MIIDNTVQGGTPTACSTPDPTTVTAMSGFATTNEGAKPEIAPDRPPVGCIVCGDHPDDRCPDGSCFVPRVPGMTPALQFWLSTAVDEYNGRHHTEHGQAPYAFKLAMATIGTLQADLTSANDRALRAEISLDRRIDEIESLRGECDDLIAGRDALRADRDTAELIARDNGPWTRKGADRLADEVAVLIRRGVLDARSPAGDALQDYRDPPQTDRADRIASQEWTIEALQKERDTLRAEQDEAVSLLALANDTGLAAVQIMRDDRDALQARVQALEGYWHDEIVLCVDLFRFKAYVHRRLDEMLIDPCTAQNAVDGCRIGARLDIVSAIQASQATIIGNLTKRLANPAPILSEKFTALTTWQTEATPLLYGLRKVLMSIYPGVKTKADDQRIVTDISLIDRLVTEAKPPTLEASPDADQA